MQQSPTPGPHRPHVFLHIGTAKSGTTYLQGRFAANTDACADQGLFWPGPGWGPHVEGARNLRQVKPGKPLDPDGRWIRLVRRLDTWDGPSALVSMEWLSGLTPGQVTAGIEALGPERTTIVCTARDLLRQVIAQWQEMTKNFRPWSWSEYLDELISEQPGPAARKFWKQHDLPAILGRWGQHVPAERIVLVTVPPSGSDPSLLWSRFCSVVGVDGSDFALPEDRNESLGVVSAQLMHLVSRAAIAQGLSQEEYKAVVFRALGQQVLAPRRASEDAITVGAAATQWCQERAARLVGDVAALGVRVVGDLGELLPGTPPPGREPSAVTADELVGLAVDALTRLGVDQHRESADMRAELKELRKRLFLDEPS